MSAKRVKLPADLGGAEVDAIDADPLPMMIAGVPVTAVRVPGVGWCGVPTRALSEVPPPLPPEPPDGAAFRVKFSNGSTALIERDDSAQTAHGDRRWFSTAMGGGPAAWCEVTEADATLTPLVPGPESVTLPWHGQSHLGRDLAVAAPSPSRYRLVPFAVGGTAATVEPAVARAMAAALLTAADQAEAADRG